MPKKEYISKNYALYLVNYFGNMQAWSKEDIVSEVKRKIAEANESFLDTDITCSNCGAYMRGDESE